MKKYKRNKNEEEYIPVHIEKYCGQYPIICRSSWEKRMCEWFDYNKDVIEWSSESIRIPYIDPTKGKNYGILDEKMGKRRIYYPDYVAKFRNGKKYIIEIKPSKYIRPVKNKGKKSKKTLIEREKIYLINKAKFEAAKVFAKKLGMEFIVLTEYDIFRKNK